MLLNGISLREPSVEASVDGIPGNQTKMKMIYNRRVRVTLNGNQF